MPTRYKTREYIQPIIDGKNLSKLNFKDTKELFGRLEKINLENMYLEGESFSGIDFTGASLKNAMMGGVSIDKSSLRGANLEGVYFEDGSLEGADLTGAKISGADFIHTDLRAAIFNNIKSSNVCFESAIASKAEFKDVDFDNKTSFKEAVLNNTDFTNAKISGADFIHTDLKDAKLNNIKSSNVCFDFVKASFAEFKDVEFDNTSFKNAILNNTDFTNAKLHNAIFTNAYLRYAYLYKTELPETNFKDADLTEANLSKSDLTGANLTDANLTGAFVNQTNLTGANLTSAKLNRINLRRANLTDAILTGAILTGADLEDANLTGANLTGANLTGANLEGANLEGVIGLVEVNNRNQGVAYEIHNQFNFDFDFAKFMETIRKYNEEHSGNKSSHSPASPRSKSDEATPDIQENEDALEITRRLLKPLIDYPVYTQKKKILKQLNIAYERRDEDAIQDTIIFVLLQSPKFIKEYIKGFTNDCAFAYSSGRRTSCIKGQYERIFLNIKTTIQSLCLDTDINGIKSDCKETYKDLYSCFLPDNVDKIMSEWWDSQTDLEDYLTSNKKEFIKKKSAEFKQHFIDKYSEKFASAIDKYIEKTFTVAYFDSTVEKPKTPTPIEPQVNIRYSGQNYNFKVVPDITTIGELKSQLLQKMVEDGKIPDKNYAVNFIYSGKRYSNDKNAETISSVIGTNYGGTFNALLTSGTGMGKTRKRLKKVKKEQSKRLRLKKLLQIRK
jgi:uncharacterized protein YjbI with pentapeptide repeats